MRYLAATWLVRKNHRKGRMMGYSNLFLLFWTVVILYVLGQIWVAQIAVYPLFGQVGE